MVDLAERCGVPLISASSLRFVPEILAVPGDTELGPLIGADVYMPAILHPANPGLLHYGVHGVEMLYALLGTGCREVSCTFNTDGEVVVGRWADGRIGVVRGLRRGARGYGFTAFGEAGIRATPASTRYLHRDFLGWVVPVLGGSPWPISGDELVEVVAFQEAALASARADGRPVSLSVG